MEFSREEYWSGLPFPSLGDIPDPGIQPTSLASPALPGRFFTTEPPGKPYHGDVIPQYVIFKILYISFTCIILEAPRYSVALCQSLR